MSDKLDVRSAGKYSEPVFDLMRIIPVDARGYGKNPGAFSRCRGRRKIRGCGGEGAGSDPP